MNKKQISYWAVTALFCLAMGISGILNLIRFEGMQDAITGLGYPAYLMSILGVAKILGVIVLLIPKMPLLKEWAYAGFTFDMLGASCMPSNRIRLRMPLMPIARQNKAVTAQYEICFLFIWAPIAG